MKKKRVKRIKNLHRCEKITTRRNKYDRDQLSLF